MATFTVAIPEELKRKIGQYPEVQWAEYLKGRFEVRLREMVTFEGLRNSGRI